MSNAIEDASQYPEEWGIYLPYRGIQHAARTKDLELLENLRDAFAEKAGEILTWKFDLAPLAKSDKESFPGMVFAMSRLWRCGLISKFATTFHTISDRPQYISYYIWEVNENGQECDTIRCDSETPVYFMQKRRGRKHDHGKPVHRLLQDAARNGCRGME